MIPKEFLVATRPSKYFLCLHNNYDDVIEEFEIEELQVLRKRITAILNNDDGKEYKIDKLIVGAKINIEPIYKDVKLK